MTRRVLLLLCILFCLISCGISKSTSARICHGDKSVSAYFPRKVVLQLCQTDPTLRLEIIDVLARNLADAGIEVVSPGGLADTVTICNGSTLSEEARKSLRDNLNIDGLFVGTLEQRRVEPLLLTRFRLELIGNPSGKLIWTTKVKIDQLAAWADIKTTATRTTELALESFRKEFLGHSKGTKSMTEKKGR